MDTIQDIPHHGINQHACNQAADVESIFFIMASEKIQLRYAELLSHAKNIPNSEYLSKIVGSWLEGEGALPQRLGLKRSDFKELMARYFQIRDCCEDAPSGCVMEMKDNNPEIDELIELFMDHRAAKSESEYLMAAIMAVGCQASDHLWQDMGFWSRADLSAMIRKNFPSLFDLNVRNMKWKKFFYKQMCMDLDATYTCRMPSCLECCDYRECYPATEDLKDEFDKETISGQL